MIQGNWMIFSGLRILVIDTACIKDIIEHGDDSTVVYLTTELDNHALYDHHIDDQARDVLECNTLDLVVSKSIDFELYDRLAYKYMYPVVTPQWVQDCISQKKLIKQYQRYSPNPRHILKNQVMCLSPLIEDKALVHLLQDLIVMTMGGTLRDFISEKTTHIIVMSMDDPIVSEIATMRDQNILNPSVKVSTYKWVLNCFKEMKLDPIGNQFTKQTTLFQTMKFNLSLDGPTQQFLTEFIESQDGELHENDEQDQEQVYTIDNVHITATWLLYMWSINSYCPANTNKLFMTPALKEKNSGNIGITHCNELKRWYVTRIIEWTGFTLTHSSDTIISLSNHDHHRHKNMYSPSLVIDALVQHVDPSNYRSFKRKRERDDEAEESVIRAVSTSCLKELTQRDKRELRHSHNIEIVDEVTPLVNCIIAPRAVKTEKFLKAIGNKAMRYIVKPEYIETLIRGESASMEEYLLLDIPMVSSRYELFQQSGIYAVNLVNDIPVGTEQIKSILEYHGLQVQVLPTRFTLDDLKVNSSTPSSIKYILVAHRQSQVHRLSKLLAKEKDTDTLIVQWDWVVQCLFTGTVSLSANTEGILG